MLLILFASCEKNSNENTNPENSIIGKWTLVSYRISNFENTGQPQDDFEGLFPRPTLEFKANNLCYIVIDADDYFKTIEYAIAENRIFFEEPIAFNHSSFTYDLSGNTLTLTRNDNFNNSIGNYTESTKIILTK
jgi:hypothetical protein